MINDNEIMILNSINSALKRTELFETKDLDQKFAVLGISSIDFLTVVISICEQLNIDLMTLNTTEFTVEMTIREFSAKIENYL